MCHLAYSSILKYVSEFTTDQVELQDHNYEANMLISQFSAIVISDYLYTKPIFILPLLYDVVRSV